MIFLFPKKYSFLLKLLKFFIQINSDCYLCALDDNISTILFIFNKTKGWNNKSRKNFDAFNMHFLDFSKKKWASMLFANWFYFEFSKNSILKSFNHPFLRWNFNFDSFWSSSFRICFSLMWNLKIEMTYSISQIIKKI